MELFVIAINLVVIAAIAFAVGKKQQKAFWRFYWPALLTKLAAGIAIGMIYRYYYASGDTFILFEEAKELTSLSFREPGAYISFLLDSGAGDWKGFLRSVFFVKIISIINIFSYSNYWITSLWFSLIAFGSAWYFFTVVVRYFPGCDFAAAIAFLFFPSVVFWSAGIMKESISLAGVYMLAGIYLKMMKSNKPGVLEAVAAVVGAWILWKLKYYWAAVLFPVLIASLIMQWSKNRWEAKTSSKLILWFCLVIVLCLGAAYLHPNFKPDRFLTVLVENHNAFLKVSYPDNLIHYSELEATWTSVIVNAPWALLSGLFRPFITEAHNVLSLVAACENLFLLAIIATARNIRYWRNSPNKTLVVSVIVYSLVLCIFLSISTPNFGSLARYKTGFMPFLVFVLLYRHPLSNFLTARLSKTKN